MESTITYFETAGAGNTDVTLALATKRALEVGAKRIVLASTTGETARKASVLLQDADLKLVIVPHQRGFRDEERFDPALPAELERQGHHVYWGTMLFHTNDLYGNNAPTALANALRTLGQGMKVCLEILLMATDGGMVERGERVVVVAGTGRGADTAVVATASTSNRIREVKIHEILCKPLLAEKDKQMEREE